MINLYLVLLASAEINAYICNAIRWGTDPFVIDIFKINFSKTTMGISKMTEILQTTENSNASNKMLAEIKKSFNRMFSLGLGALDPFEVLVNCLMLAPLGVMACQNAKARGKKTAKFALLAGLLLSTTIEVCQMILPFGRYPTVIDICWNVLGAGIGCACLNIF